MGCINSDSRINAADENGPPPTPDLWRRGELAGNRTQDPRLKRALLYQLSYELENCRFLNVNIGASLGPERYWP